jgi:hypothetical protein
LARGRLREKLPQLEQALAGQFGPHHRFLVAQQLAHIDFLDAALEPTFSTAACPFLENKGEVRRGGEARIEVGGVPGSDAYVAERLDHLGIVAGVCREIGLATWLDAQDEQTHERVGVGTATVAMILNGLGFSNRRLYLVPQFFATKAVERLLGPGITAEDLNDDCLGRTLDWLYAHDPTTLFAGIALRARRAFGITARQVHVDTTSFAVTGDYASDLDAHTLAVTYGYSRDHRADLKQWMLALATTRHGDVPLFCQALDGNASDKVTLVAAVEALAEQLRAAADSEDAAPLFVADSGLYTADNVARLSAAGVRWISRVPDTSKEARAALGASEDAWGHDGDLHWAAIPQAPEGQRWVVVRTTQGEGRARGCARQDDPSHVLHAAQLAPGFAAMWAYPVVDRSWRCLAVPHPPAQANGSIAGSGARAELRLEAVAAGRERDRRREGPRARVQVGRERLSDAVLRAATLWQRDHLA